MYIPCNLKFMKKRPEAVARSWWISQKIYFITFKSYISQQYFLVKTFFLNQSMTSQWPPKIVPIHTCHPVFLRHWWFVKNLGKDYIPNNMHTTVSTFWSWVLERSIEREKKSSADIKILLDFAIFSILSYQCDIIL